MPIDNVTGLFTVGNITLLLYIINFIIAVGIIFFDKKTPVATLAWLMILFLVPIVGLVLYIIFSQHIARLKIYKLSDQEMQIGLETQKLQAEMLEENPRFHYNSTIAKWKELAEFNLSYSNSLITHNDEIELITDGTDWFDMLLEDIENAKESINVNFFVVKDDFVGKKFIKALTKKAKEGVEVRLLMDALGSKGITNRKLKEFEEAGGKYAFFFKPKIRHIYLRINYRNHRKIAVIDKKVAYTGGFNIAKEYLGAKKKFGYWRDSAIRITGTAVAMLNMNFLLDWDYARGESTDLLEEVYYKDLNSEFEGDILAQIVSCGPNTDKEQIKMAMMKMIVNAKENIYIQTPYFVPDESIINALILAANSGVEINIMIPCMPDHPFVYRTTLLNAGRLIENGANIYIYENGFLHAKTLIVDDEVATIGSCNFDIRSFRLNFETNAFVYDERFAKMMVDQFHEDMKLSRRYTAEDRANLSLYERMAESISRLLTEVL